MNKTITYIFRILTISFFILVVGILMAARFSIPGGFRLYSVLSGSMEPTVAVGSLVIAQTPRDISAVSVGNIITFAPAGSTQTATTHRIVDTKTDSGKKYFITKGDANDIRDVRPVAIEDIQGVHTYHIPFLGRALEYLKTPIGVSIFVLVPLLLLIADELAKILRTVKTTVVSTSPLSEMPLLKPSSILKLPFLDSILHPRALPKERRQYKVKITSVGIYILFFIGITSVVSTQAAFKSNAIFINGNTLATAAVFPTPSPTPTITPTPTPTPIPTPSPAPCDDVNVTIEESNENTGEGSTNTNTVDVTNDCDIDITNDTEVTNDIDVDVITGGNESNNNTEAGNQTSGDVIINIGIQNSL
ncbi:MAG: signal peptidase I [Candidatus Andersenbacteria bacterium]|nr:signal peptidase I [Candidatus Andersenbacteria bacterium]MBI3251227.1 signal peptidase I [Candidatus Andersenbacteria bacterium]